MLARFFVVALFVLGPIGFSPAASAQSVAETLTRWGLPGVWAPDCRQRPSVGNVYYTFVAHPDGRAALARRWGDGGDESPIERASISPDGRLSVTIRFQGAGQTRVNVLAKDAMGRTRTMENHKPDGGDATVIGGRLVHNGRETPWQSRCAAPTARAADSLPASLS